MARVPLADHYASGYDVGVAGEGIGRERGSNQAAQTRHDELGSCGAAAALDTGGRARGLAQEPLDRDAEEVELSQLESQVVAL